MQCGLRKASWLVAARDFSVSSSFSAVLAVLDLQ